MSDDTVLKKRPAPLPTKIEGWQRQTKMQRTLNDLVEDIHRMLITESAEYRAFLDAVYDEDAVEGSLSADNTLAAMMIRNKAKTIAGNELTKKKLATISKALGVVLRRYHLSRKQRRNMVGGEEVPGDSGD